MTRSNHDEYLGDGVYASFDGYHIWLDLRAQDSTRIALEPQVFEALKLYGEKIAQIHAHTLANANAAIAAAEGVTS